MNEEGNTDALEKPIDIMDDASPLKKLSRK